MSRKYQIVPTNRNTLFLRNIEQYLIFNGVLETSNLKKFRQQSCNHILDMLDLYMIDEKNNSNELLMRTYTDHSYKVRFINSYQKISNQ